jgi:hypothetical protein
VKNGNITKRSKAKRRKEKGENEKTAFISNIKSKNQTIKERS